MCRVLILDDDLYFAETIKLILEEAGEAESKISTTFDDAQQQVIKAGKRGKPFEVFLIDQRLGPGKDGIQAMQELRAISPDTDAIIFTGIEDTENGVRAYEAGAFRYLSKPFENKELLFLLKALKQWRKEQREHNWQKIFSSMMEEALQHGSFQDVSRVVVEHALKLGFARVHLFWIPTREDSNAHNLMVGITCTGKDCIPDFPRSALGTTLYPLSQWFGLDDIEQLSNAIFLRSEQVDKIQSQFESFGYRWPAGEVVFLPLKGNRGLLGALLLDHGQSRNTLSEHERSLMNFFARQVAIVLENVSAISGERRSVQEIATISQIGREIMAKATEETNLSELLEEVHKQMNLLIDVSNSAFFLLDPESNQLDMRLLYKRGIRCKDLSNLSDMIIERFLLTRHGHTIFWPVDIHEYLRENKINLDGEIPRSCIGVQLHVGERVIGGITLKRYESEEQFTRRDHMLLSAVANQISGAIELLYANEIEKRNTKRLNVLRRTMMEMLRIAQENEDDLYLTVLTFATSHFGTGFNRALLFLENEERTALIGKAGVGLNDLEQARQDWEDDIKRDYQFEDFLGDLKQKRVHHTDLHGLAKEIEIPLTSKNSMIHQVLKEGQRKIVCQAETEGCAPKEILEKVTLTECAVLPIPSGNRTVGVVVVDNKHNGVPLSEKMLNQLQTLLNYTGLLFETLRQQNKSESLLDANYQIMGEAGFQSLKETLHNICETARIIMEADWVLVYPLKEGEEFVFDKENAAYAGQLKHPIIIKDRPSPEGISGHILNKGKLVINDVSNEDAEIREKHISTYEFIKKEGIKAVLAIAIRDIQRDEPLGIFYLDYRTPQNFSPTDEHHAVALASLAAIAISNARRFDEQRQRQRLEAALQTAQIISTELDFDNMLIKVLDNLKQFFQNTSMCVLTYDSDENALRFVPATLKYYRTPRSKKPENRFFPLEGPSIASKTARRALAKGESVSINVPDVSKCPEYLEMLPQSRSELCVSLLSGNHELLGVLALERTSISGFSEDDQALVETVASQLCLGMERARQSEQLSFKTTVAALTSWAADIAHDINNEAGEIKIYTYLIKELAQKDKQIIEYASRIEDSAQRLFDAGPKSVQGKQVLPLNQAIKKYAAQLAHHRDIQVEYLLDEIEYHIFVNPTDFRRVLQHLTRNADKAMSDISNKKISILTRRAENNEVEILFRDHGPGVPDEVQLSVFQKSVTTKQSGGFGLLLTRQFVEDMGGTIRLLPAEPGGGATFSIKLPITIFDDANVE